MTGMIGLDFETYSGVSLPDHGLPRYADDKTFTPLIAAVAWREPGSSMIERKRLDFATQPKGSKQALAHLIGGRTVCAHNAGFEQKVLDVLGMSLPSSRFIDSAVVARAAGGGSHLEAAAPQLLDTGKMDEGKSLIRLFSIPGRYQEENGNLLFDARVVADNPKEWDLFGTYCEVDASLGLQLVESHRFRLSSSEMEYQAITMDMNRTGWCVDVARVEEMQRRYLENLEQAMYRFRRDHDAADLNLSSLKQMKEWCAARGVKFTSFDEKHVDRYLEVVRKKLAAPQLDLVKAAGYEQVLALLETKKILGGSSLKKLRVMLDTVTADYQRPGVFRLKDQYLHCGAGQTLRTTGRSVQMQNLKQLAHPADMTDLDDPESEWDNDKLAENIRQLFTATDPYGRLVVGDFKSVESRGLAWLAGESWKLTAYRAGEDVYSRLASKMFSVSYDQVTPELRKPGKVGELACGYGAGGGAVQDFAAKMGIEMSEGEATRLVWDWRDACPKTVLLWSELNDMLHEVLSLETTLFRHLPDRLDLRMGLVLTPASLRRQHPGVRSVEMTISSRGQSVMKRYFHGCHERGRNICYYKPSDRKTGDLWRNTFTDPKTKQVRFYELYGGKLAGILTQSFCREIFFQTLVKAQRWCWAGGGQYELVGQFHDEIVVDLKPGAKGLTAVKNELGKIMSSCELAPSFPLAADIKDDYRYTK